MATRHFNMVVFLQFFLDILNSLRSKFLKLKLLKLEYKMKQYIKKLGVVEG